MMVKIIFNCHDEIGELVLRDIIATVRLMETTYGSGYMIYFSPIG